MSFITFSNLTDMFHELLNAERFVDVTLACENNTLKCHKVRVALALDVTVVLGMFLISAYVLGRFVRMLVVLPETSGGKPLQASNHNHAARNRIRRPSVHH